MKAVNQTYHKVLKGTLSDEQNFKMEEMKSQRAEGAESNCGKDPKKQKTDGGNN
jgi:hypothetical protein